MRRFMRHLSVTAAVCFTTVGLVAVGCPAVASAQAAVTCSDGTSGTAGRGACGHHGGVDHAATKAATKAAKASAKASATNAKASAKADEATESASQKASEKASEKASARATAQVTCRDGTMGTSGRGACGHHGGVAVAVAGAATASTTASTPAPMPMPSRAAPAPMSTASRAAAPAPARSVSGGSGSKEDNDPTGAVAQCKDGKFSHAKSHQGACGHHGGVSKWMTT